MLTDRGDSELVESPPTKLMSKLCHAAYESKSNGTRVFFPKNKKLKVGTLRTLGQADAIFVSELGITPFAKKELKKKSCQIFSYDELIVPVARHVDVPPHRRLPKEERDRLEKKYPTKLLPLLPESDPICKYYNFRPGDVVEITRTSTEGHSYLYWRLVVQ